MTTPRSKLVSTEVGGVSDTFAYYNSAGNTICYASIDEELLISCRRILKTGEILAITPRAAAIRINQKEDLVAEVILVITPGTIYYTDDFKNTAFCKTVHAVRAGKNKLREILKI